MNIYNKFTFTNNISKYPFAQDLNNVKTQFYGYKTVGDEGWWIQVKKEKSQVKIECSFLQPPLWYKIDDDGSYIISSDFEYIGENMHNIIYGMEKWIGAYSIYKKDTSESALKGISPLEGFKMVKWNSKVTLKRDYLRIEDGPYTWGGKPLTKKAIEKWHDKYLNYFKSLKSVKVTAALSAGNDTRILNGLLNESGINYIVYTGDKDWFKPEWAIVNNVAKTIGKEVDTWKDFTKTDFRVEGTGSEWCREPAVLNKFSCIQTWSILIYRMLAYVPHIKAIFPYLDSELCSMTCTDIDDIHRLIYTRYYPELMEIPLFASNTYERYYYYFKSHKKYMHKYMSAGGTLSPDKEHGGVDPLETKNKLVEDNGKLVIVDEK